MLSKAADFTINTEFYIIYDIDHSQTNSIQNDEHFPNKQIINKHHIRYSISQYTEYMIKHKRITSNNRRYTASAINTPLHIIIVKEYLLSNHHTLKIWVSLPNFSD